MYINRNKNLFKRAENVNKTDWIFIKKNDNIAKKTTSWRKKNSRKWDIRNQNG